MVETGGLENRFALTGNGGSNPSPSATPSLRNASALSISLRNEELAPYLAIRGPSSAFQRQPEVVPPQPIATVSLVRVIGETGHFASPSEKRWYTASLGVVDPSASPSWATATAPS